MLGTYGLSPEWGRKEHWKGLGSAVGMASRYGLDDREVGVLVPVHFF
jgi:hypothetical protein